ncbi:MAG: hypothetical protein ABIQ97_00075 [Lysobacteraceae bacterium]
MGLIGMLWGIVSVLWMMLAFIPLLGWGNWFMIPFAGVGLIISGLGYALTALPHRGRARAGLWLNGLAIVIGVLRLHLGGGII